MSSRPLASLAWVLLLVACPSASNGPAVVVEGTCEIASGSPAPGYLQHIGCTADFQALASAPLDATLPGARSTKIVLDQAPQGGTLYFQNSVKYQIHYEFALAKLSGNGLPIVPPLAEFNTTEYFSPDRRFLLGAVTYYDGPKRWALEVAPYDTASASMIATLFRAVQKAAFFGPALAFHPTSDSVQSEASNLPKEIPVVTTDDLFAGIDYQPLNLGTAIGRLHFAKAADLETEYLSYEDIVVLDEAPNDITVVQGLITEEFQTPLSHVNVLSLNRHTPNMGLRGAMQNAELRALEGKPVELTVGALSFSVRQVTDAEAQAFWQAHKPVPVVLPAANLEVKELTDIEKVTAEPKGGVTLRDAIKTAVLAFGGKAAHYSVLARIKGVPMRKAFSIPIYYYDQFMRANGFYDQLDVLLADGQFQADCKVRDQKLEEFRKAMLKAPVDGGLQTLLKAKLSADYAGLTMRFRTSTNSEDLEGFPCAGCYESHTGDPATWDDVLDAIRMTYASTWLFRTFEERRFYSIDHKSVGMALLVHHNFPDEEANGVAVTANPFDASGLNPAFYVNVQIGGTAEVVHPPAGVKTDQYLHYFSQPNQPVTYLSHSTLIPKGTTVLTATQTHELGVALDAIQTGFSPAYGPGAGNKGWYAMDVEFKFDNENTPSQPPSLFIKQARPYPKPGGS